MTRNENMEITLTMCVRVLRIFEENSVAPTMKRVAKKYADAGQVALDGGDPAPLLKDEI